MLDNPHPAAGLGGVHIFGVAGAVINVRSSPAGAPITLDPGIGTDTVNIGSTANSIADVHGYSLVQLLHDKRGVRNKSRLPRLSKIQILAWVEDHLKAMVTRFGQRAP